MSEAKNSVILYGSEILKSSGMESEKNYIQHGSISCYEHSVRVAEESVRIASFFHARVNMPCLVRGALLHDYFLYDWHESSPDHKLHGFTHARCALGNACRDFPLNPVEKDIISKHMFPLNIRIPRFKESWIVCLADKICAVGEIFSAHSPYGNPA